VIRQSFASAFGIDELAMKTELEEKQAFTLKLRDDRESLIFDEAYWSTLLKPQGVAPTIFEAAFQDLNLSQLYVGLAGMSAETRRSLVQLLDQEELLRRAPQLALYGSSIVIDRGRVVVPGGEQAVGSWKSLTKESPDQPGPFVRNLLRRDGGKLFAYYHAIATLPQQNQRFFTSTTPRLSSFYQVFPFEDEVAIDHDAFVRRDDAFVRLARDLRFDEDGSIHFPGSGRIWMIASGSSANADALQALYSRIDRSKPPDTEDEILLMMLGRKYDQGVQKVSQIENFLAVAHIESHRSEPLDERTALALSQIYPKYRSVFPYFAALPALRSDAIDAFLRAAEQLEKFEGVPLNTALGEFHALVQLTVVFEELGLLSDGDAAELFTFVCIRMSSVKKQEDLGAAALEAIERILQRSGRPMDASSDEFFLRAVAGEIEAADFSETTIARIREVLRLQSIGPLDPVLKLYRDATALSKGEPVRWEDVEESVARLTEIEEEPGDELPKTFRREFIIGDLQEVSAIVATLKSQLAAKRPPRDVQKTAARLIETLNPFLKTTLVGWIYAYYFSPRDLAIASDRYLVRRHTFYDGVTRDYWPGARVAQYFGNIRGSYLMGGFAELAAAAGMVAKTNVQARDSIQMNNYVTATSAQLAAARSVPWRRVTDMGMHSVALKLRLGREFVVLSAFDPDVLRELEVATTGLIGAGRRFELVDALADRDFVSAMKLLGSGDLYFLADALMRVPEYAKLNGPVRSSFEIAGKEMSGQHDYFGGFHRMTLGCAHPHLVPLAPFEEYENHRLLEPLAERLSDVLLDLAEAADRDGVSAQALARLAEPAIRRYSSRIAGYGQRDWMSAIETMRSVDLKTLSPGFERN
jgi:hypothetical protein